MCVWLDEILEDEPFSPDLKTFTVPVARLYDWTSNFLMSFHSECNDSISIMG